MGVPYGWHSLKPDYGRFPTRLEVRCSGGSPLIGREVKMLPKTLDTSPSPCGQVSSRYYILGFSIAPTAARIRQSSESRAACRLAGRRRGPGTCIRRPNDAVPGISSSSFCRRRANAGLMTSSPAAPDPEVPAKASRRRLRQLTDDRRSRKLNSREAAARNDHPRTRSRSDKVNRPCRSRKLDEIEAGGVHLADLGVTKSHSRPKCQTITRTSNRFQNDEVSADIPVDLHEHC
jgi:hypothetical protein